MHGGVLDGDHRFDAAVEIARHHVGRTNVHSGIGRWQALSLAKTINACMFEKAADQALDAYVLGQPGNSRSQATDSANDEIDLDASATRLVKLR